MSSRDDPNALPGREREPRWRPEPEVGPASGGHLAPDVHATGPLFESVSPPERAPRERTPRERTQPLPPAEAQRRRSSSQQPKSRRRHTVRRVKRTLRHVDPVSIFKLSLFFYGIGVLAWLLLVAILYSVLESSGLFRAIELVREGFAFEGEFEITLWVVEKWAFFIGLVLWLVGSLVNLLIAFLYNVGADTIGGVEMTFVEREQP